MEKSVNKRGQVTIFIIIGILLVAGVVLFFVIRGSPGPDQQISDLGATNPNSFLKSCVNDNIRNSIRTLGNQGGYFHNPLNETYTYPNEPTWEVSYLCYDGGINKPCNVIQPTLINHLQVLISETVEDDLDNCYENLIGTYKAEGYKVNDNYGGFELKLIEDEIKVELVNTKVSLSKNDQSTTQKKFTFSIPTQFFDISWVANEIVSQESQYCNFNKEGYMSLYPDFNIKDDRVGGDGTTIYTVEHTESKEKIRFIVRSCIAATEI